MYKGYNEACNRASQKYQRTHLEQVRFWVPKGSKDKYKAYAQSKGVSLTNLITELLNKDMEAAGFAAPEPPPEDGGESG